MPQEQGRQVPIRRTISPNLPLVFVNDFLVTSSPNELFITFSELLPPVILVPEDLQKIDSVEAKAVVRLVVTPAFAKQIVKSLSEHLEKQKDISDTGRSDLDVSTTY